VEKGRKPRRRGGGGASAVALSPVPPTPLPLSHQLRARTRYIHRAVVIVGLHAVVLVGLCAIVIVGLRAVVFCRFWKLPRAGEVLPKFPIYTDLFSFYAGEGPVGAKPEYLGDPDCLRWHCRSVCTASPHHYTDSSRPR
jgi:hypothetical protein